jgi:hypothetical protein
MLAKENLTTHFYVPFYLHAKDALRNINFGSMPNLITAQATVTDQVITLPTDCLKLITLYELRGDRKAEFAEDRTLAQTVQTWEDVEVADQPDYIDGINQGRDGDRGAKFRRTFQFVDGTNTIRIKEGSEVPATMYIRYISTNPVSGSNSLIHPMVEQCIDDWVKWKRSESGKIKRLDSTLLRRNFHDSLSELRSNRVRITKQLLIQTSRKMNN